MAHVAINGGEEAILKSQTLLAEQRRGDVAVPEITLAQIASQFGLAVDRVMSEGSLYDRDLAALALKQAQGDALEAIFLLRAYRTTLPRIAASEPIDTSKMNVRRRVSATFKDVPCGQVLGATYDFTHRLLDFALSETADGAPREDVASEPLDARMPSALDPLLDEGLIEEDVRSDAEAYDLTREPLCLPAGRDQRLQNLARGDEGFLLGLAYSSARGYGSVHPFVGELRAGEVTIQITPEELGFPIDIADIGVT
ncbi:MAG: carbon-phosphorus lyase complex subunit PhnI, partial [Methylocystaceae bacterium]